MEWRALPTDQPCGQYGWCMPPDAARAGVPPLPPASHMPPEDAELAELAGRALRVLLGSGSVLLHTHLRMAVLGRGDGLNSGAASRSKSLLELAVAWLVEQGLVLRQGQGPFAALTVPDAALSKAEALAYSEFPDEGQLPLLATAGRALGSAPRPASCLNRLRRHSSPRQLGSRMAGIEKAGVRRSKRGMGEDLSSQMVKKMRMQENIGCQSGSGMPFSASGGCVAMSP